MSLTLIVHRRKPRLLDLCCGAGGAAVGYARAGFEVVGVDMYPQPNYPFAFHQDDALTFPLDGFDLYHASVPCKHWSQATTFHPGAREKHIPLIEPMRQRLQATGLPSVLENVERAPLLNPVKLCGHMFGLRVYRHRLFESNVLLLQPAHRKHIARAADASRIPHSGEFWSICGHFGHKEEAAAAMGIDWMKRVEEIAQAIPPAYTECLGLQLKEVFR
jgi:DNA (cytosine-5)-methyltransferase 1